MKTNEKDFVSPEFLELQKEFVNNFLNANSVATLHDFINSMPYAAAILTPDRRALFTNYSLLNKYGFQHIEQVLGKRPGEIIGCIHATNNGNQCGVSQNCKVCGALAAMKKTQITQKANISEMHLTSTKEGSPVSFDLRVTVAPLLVNKKVFLILYINDISHEKRRKAIERIFFHDILNKVSMLNGLYDLMLKNPSGDNKTEHLELMGLILSDLTDEISSQRQLAAAENGELNIKMESILLMKLLNRVVQQVTQLSNPKEIGIDFLPDDNNVVITSDATILNRVITNLLKNAIEASLSNQTVRLSFKTMDKKVEIMVSNPTFMPAEVQMQIFQRSFSTKGDNRGLGTYSIKLLTERYLGGKVSFVSNPEDGTSFIIELSTEK